MKPKENTIAKIDQLAKQLKRQASPAIDLELALALQQRCHTMNIHKAKVLYFKRIKVALTRALELSKATASSEEALLLGQEMRALLDANNG